MLNLIINAKDEAIVGQQITENHEKTEFWNKMVRETGFTKTKDKWAHIVAN